MILERRPEWEAADTVTVIESAFPRFGKSEITYDVAVYRADLEKIAARAEAGGNDLAAVRGYSKSKAKADECLTYIENVTVVLHGNTGEILSFEEFPGK